MKPLLGEWTRRTIGGKACLTRRYLQVSGGLLLSLRPGAGFVMEQTRMTEGVWLPRLAQINLSVKVLLFGGGDLNKTIERSNYKHFKGEVGDYRL